MLLRLKATPASRLFAKPQEVPKVIPKFGEIFQAIMGSASTQNRHTQIVSQRDMLTYPEQKPLRCSATDKSTEPIRQMDIGASPMNVWSFHKS
jgi:hypothetical protein